MFDDLAREEVVEAVDRAVAELLQSAGMEAPPVDAIVLAQRHLGISVCLDRRQQQRGRADDTENVHHQPSTVCNAAMS